MSDDSSSPELDLEDTSRFLRDILGDSTSLYHISPSGELVRAISRFNRRTARLSRVVAELERTAEEAQAARLRAEQFRQGMSSNNLRDRVRRQRARIGANRSTENLPPSVSPPIPPPSTNDAPASTSIHRPTLPQISSAPPRPRMTESGRLLEVHRNLTEGRRSSPISASALANLAEMHQAGQQLQQVISQSRALLDTPMPTLEPSNIEAREYADEAESNRAFKRRRLGPPVPEPQILPVNYGYYGQVEPGKLNMEIEFCDGGTYSGETERDNTTYGAANVLKADNSVYSTKSNRCNLVLRHQGGRPFCLKELIIKAPPRGYTAPVQEGMVFVSMASDELLTRTTKYQIQYLPTTQRQSGENNTVPRPPVISIRHNGDGTTTATRQPPMVFHDGDHPPRPAAQIPADFTDPTCAQPFRVTTSCSSDTESDTESTTTEDRRQHHSAYRMRARRRAERERMGNALAGYELNSDEDSDEEPPAPIELDWTDEVSAEWVPRSRSRSHSRSGRRSQPASVSLALENAIEAADEATEEAIKAVDGARAGQGLMAPHARFFIERDKSRCRVVFEPEVSGRFILLKMWNPEMGGEGNIDIQSVVVKGWCGGRWFPKVVLR